MREEEEELAVELLTAEGKEITVTQIAETAPQSTTAFKNLELQDIERMATHMYKARFFADITDAHKAVIKLIAARELGLPLIKANSIYIVKGRLALQSDIIAALIKGSNRYDYELLEYTDAVCRIQFFNLKGGDRIALNPPIEWDLTRAKKAQLGGEAWAKYTRAMLFARALTEGARLFCADVFGGSIYTKEELEA